MRTTKWMRWGGTAIAVGMFASAGPVDAQWNDDGDRWERLAERIQSRVEAAMARTEAALERWEYRADRWDDEDWADMRWDVDADAIRTRGRWNIDIDMSWLDDLGEALSDIDWSEADWSYDAGDRDGDAAWWSDRNAGPRVGADDWEWRGRVDRGDVLEIKGISGPVRATRASGSEIEVVAMRSARRSDPESVTFEVLEHSGGVTLCAMYPTPDRADRRNECGVGDEGRMNVNRNDTSVEWEVRVPAGVNFTVRNVNGDVEIERLDSDVRVSTVNGDVDLETSGAAEAKTVNGDVRARFDVLNRDVEFETVNGSLELDVADDLDADVDAGWLNGSLDSDVPLTLRGRMSRRSAQGTLGDGGPMLRLRTVNGSIRIR